MTTRWNGTSGPRQALELVHHHPGRLRVRSEAFRADPDLVADVRDAVQKLPGVLRVEHREPTGSLLVESDPEIGDTERILAEIVRVARLEGPLDARAMRERRPSFAVRAVNAAREANDIVHEMTGLRADLRVLVPGAIAALGAYSFVTNANGPRIPRWDNLLYWSYNIFTQLHRREIDGDRTAQSGGGERMR